MSKYDKLWNWIKDNGNKKVKLTFEEVEKIAGRYKTYIRESQKKIYFDVEYVWYYDNLYSYK